jgi:hypothetical protein
MMRAKFDRMPYMEGPIHGAGSLKLPVNFAVDAAFDFE